jgi:hypothetical protein
MQKKANSFYVKKQDLWGFFIRYFYFSVPPLPPIQRHSAARIAIQPLGGITSSFTKAGDMIQIENC